MKSSSKRKVMKAKKVMMVKKDSKGAGDDGAPSGKGKKSVEQQYQKKTQVEHILLRPDSYVGSIEQQEESHWVWNGQKEEMEFRKISFVPALYKIFDEILVNAS